MTRTDQNREDGTERTALLSNYSDSSSLSTRTTSASLSSWSTAAESSGVRSYGTVSDSNQNGINNTTRTVDIGNSAVEAEVHNRSEAARTNFVDIEEGDNLQQQEDREEYENASNANQSVAETDVGGRIADNASEQRQQEGRTTEETAAGDEPRDGSIGNLTRRLRCLFRAITWPIIPLGTVVTLAFLWVMYAASSLDLREYCSHPLHSYAFTSLVLVAYIPYHSQVRSRIFHYSRERDGPMRPARVRMYDQFFHTVCLLYVYTGVTLIQSCRADVVDRNLIDIANSDLTLPNEGPLNTCQATCPNLYQALSVYVATLELFTFALILPLLFLPCIYLWFLQRATEEAEELQDRLQEVDALLSNGGITTGEILDSLEVVKMVSRPATGSSPRNTSNDANEDPVIEEELGSQQLWILPDAAKLNECIGVMCDVKECCICMSEFDVEVQEDDKGQDTSLREEDNDGDRYLDENEIIVRTRCGHIFHKECLKGWVGGMWSATTNNSNSSNNHSNNTNADGSPPDW
eukprot:CAMPEP_0172396656 /NCGR_PEP_ID=MMETSP1061-20121228/26365_1 /TAXON_ID=37318 /ORGANISM="Pseudo-nitzschia pungens, Strain cf. pungens" /LENGTH=520 /DNA_ID=CAMNT_0013128587 /DNA_START=219 /DNA_END=1778 /DNA_ORIENTATION=-